MQEGNGGVGQGLFRFRLKAYFRPFILFLELGNIICRVKAAYAEAIPDFMGMIFKDINIIKKILFERFLLLVRSAQNIFSFNRSLVNIF